MSNNNNGFSSVQVLEKNMEEKRQYYKTIKKQRENYSDIITNWDRYLRTYDDLKIKATLFKNESERAKNENRKIRLYAEYKQNYFKIMQLIIENYCDILASISDEILTSHTVSHYLETINKFEAFLYDVPENIVADERDIIIYHDTILQELYCALNSKEEVEEEK